MGPAQEMGLGNQYGSTKLLQNWGFKLKPSSYYSPREQELLELDPEWLLSRKSNESTHQMLEGWYITPLKLKRKLGSMANGHASFAPEKERASRSERKLRITDAQFREQNSWTYLIYLPVTLLVHKRVFIKR